MRVSKKMLENKVDQLNNITNSPMQYFGDYDVNVGHFCISGAYGGYELQRTCNNGGGVRTFFNTGHIPKKELYNLICAFINGIELQAQLEEMKNSKYPKGINWTEEELKTFKKKQ